MKFIAIIFALFAFLFGMSDAVICATDQRSGNPQNFAGLNEMNAENARGGAYVWKHDGPC